MDDLARLVNKLSEGQNALVRLINNLSADVARHRYDQQNKEKIDALIRMQSAVYSSAQGYTNAVIVGGYAAVFAIWSFTKPVLPQWALVLTALLMVVSIASFVVWEVVKMVGTTIANQHFMRVAKAPPEHLGQALKEYQAEADRLNIGLSRIWPAFLATSVITGLLAALVLVMNFIWRLLALPGELMGY